MDIKLTCQQIGNRSCSGFVQSSSVERVVEQMTVHNIEVHSMRPAEANSARVQSRMQNALARTTRLPGIRSQSHDRWAVRALFHAS